MSTLDKSFIRAYSKDADVRGVTGPAWYSPYEQAGPSTDAGEYRDPRLDAWRPLEQLYAEGIWYRIEPRQSTPPLPHIPIPSPVRARNLRESQPAPILAETVDDRLDRGSQPEASGATSPHRAEQAPPQWLWEFSSQYVISAAVGCVADAPSTGEVVPAGAKPGSSHEVGVERRTAAEAVASAEAEQSVARQATVAANRPATTRQEAAATSPASSAHSSAPAGAAQATMPKTAPSPSAVNVELVSPEGLEVPRLDDAESRVPSPHFAVQKASGSARAELPPRPSPPPSANARQGSRFEPSWEVDAFVWPELTDRLLRRETRRFTLLTETLAGAARTGRNVVAVTSPAREQGRTTLSLCLARRAAAAGLKVALVDADFENPCLAQRLRVNPTCGWQDTLAANLPLAEAAVASTRDGVTLLPLRMASISQDDEIPLDPGSVTELIDQLSDCFDLVILDMEPAEPEDLADAEPAADADEVDTSLHPALIALLVFDESSDEDQLADAVAQLRTAGIETLGAVENFFPART